MEILKSFSLFLISLLLVSGFALFVSAELTNPSANVDFSAKTNDWQSSSPTFDDYYRGSVNTYWPILKNMENDNCDAVASDFIVTIPFGGCSPSIVRSDILAEQNVPVFCQLSAIRVNPLIDVSTIKSISFKGDYPSEVAGISFHPARAATSSSKTLLGRPIEENIGYVVIVLDKQSNESSLNNSIKGNLTATIKYDTQSSFGSGAGEYYLEPVSDSEWERNADASSFWRGKGYLRVKNVDSDSATIEVLTSKDNSYETITLKEGETSSSIYYPGQYCTSALKVKLNKIDNSEDMAKIDIDGDTFWVRKGSKLLDGKCTVTKLNLLSDDDGVKVEISCSGNSRFPLELTKGDKEISNKEYEETSSIPKYLGLAEKSVLSLIDNYPSERKEDGEYWGEEALYRQILLAGDVGNIEMQNSLIDIFLKTYPDSATYESIRALKVRIGEFDYSMASRSLTINNDNYNIRVDGFVKGRENDNNVSVRIDGGDIMVLLEDKSYTEGGVEVTDSDQVPLITVRNVDSTSAEFYYTWNKDGKPVHETFTVEIGEYSNAGGKPISVVDTSVREVAYISLIPGNSDTKTEANFTFSIDVEKRALELTPERARNKINILNESINEWEDRLEVLGNVVEGTKAACFITSSALMLKNTLSGFSGEGLAREKIMDLYELKCRADGAGSSAELHKCYSENSNEIEQAVKEYGANIDAVNEKVKCAKTSDTVSDSFLESEVIDTKRYVDNLARCTGLSSSWNYEMGDTIIKKGNLTDASDYSAVLLREEACKNEEESSNICKMATAAMEKALSDNVDMINNKILSYESEEGLGVAFNFANLNSDAQLVYYKNAPKNIPLADGSYILKGSKYSEVTLDGINYIVVLGLNDVITDVYRYNQGNLEKTVDDEAIKKSISGFASFVQKSDSSGSCSNRMTSPYVRYYESQNQQGFVATVPLNVVEGWYVHVDVTSYTDSGVANAFWVCNVGDDGIISDGVSGGDVCVEFRTAVGSDVPFTPCLSKTKSEITKIYSDAERIIREANTNKNGITINGEYIPKISPLGSDSSEVECTDFMSVADCNIMFNVCDPVICPTSRCDLGGEFPVADVVSTGIFGSMALCFPNFGKPSEGGVLVPICLSGVYAGLDSYLSVMKSYRSCLEKNIETGEYVGICDEINAVYVCEFFWGQLSPILDNFLPKVVESMLGGVQTRGGAEYLTTQKSFDILDKSINYFTSNYAEGAFKAFDLKNTEEIGSTYCKNFVGGSVPTSSSFIDNLVSPESPTQFYAHFSEDLFTDATVPSTSHYKVYYHIYAGNDAGTQYKIYLKSPPELSYYANRQTLLVDSGYVAKGTAADESIDFTAPTGYKELCTDINGREECGFGSVTSDFGLNYASQSYISDQADDVSITRSEDCVTTSASAWGMVNLNIQSGIEDSIGGEDISNSGITRICASTNPEQGVVGGNDVYCKPDSGLECSPGYECKKITGEIKSDIGICESKEGVRQINVERWIDVGYCDSESVRCWIDSNSVEDNLGTYMAVNEITSVNDIMLESEELKELEENYKNVREKLNSQRNAIELLNRTHKELKDGVVMNTVNNIIKALDEIAGVEDGYVGQGTNADKAEALSMKTGVYIAIVRELLNANPDIRTTGSSLDEADEVREENKKEENKDDDLEEEKDDELETEVESVALTKEGVLLGDIKVGNIIVKDNIEYTVTSVKTTQKESVLSLYSEYGDMSVIRSDPNFLLKGQGYELAPTTQYIEKDTEEELDTEIIMSSDVIIDDNICKDEIFGSCEGEKGKCIIQSVNNKGKYSYSCQDTIQFKVIKINFIQTTLDPVYVKYDYGVWDWSTKESFKLDGIPKYFFEHKKEMNSLIDVLNEEYGEMPLEYDGEFNNGMKFFFESDTVPRFYFESIS